MLYRLLASKELLVEQASGLSVNESGHVCNEIGR